MLLFVFECPLKVVELALCLVSRVILALLLLIDSWMFNRLDLGVFVGLVAPCAELREGLFSKVVLALSRCCRSVASGTAPVPVQVAML